MENSHTLPNHSLPPIEKLLDPEQAAHTWPAYSTRPDFGAQLEAQRFVLDSFRAVTKALPIGHSPVTAVESGILGETDAINVYRGLTEYLEREPGHARLALFLPLEFTAPASPHSSVELQSSNAAFQRAFRSAWEAQLTEHEVRANFTDGDVLEAELRDGDHPRVVKATHLIPGLVASGHLSVEAATDYADRTQDPLLREGIHDALAIIKRAAVVKPAGGTELFRFEVIRTELLAKLARIERCAPTHSTPARTAWLKYDATERAVAEAAVHVAKRLTLGAMLPTATEANEPVLTAHVDGLRQAALTIPRVYERHDEWLQNVRERSQSPRLQDALSKLYAHLHATGTISDATLNEYGIRLPRLAGPLSANLAQNQDFLTEVEGMSERIAEHPYLGDRVHPIVLVFGSQLKGYGTVNADADVAVFIKAGVERSERERLEAELAAVFSHEKIGGKAVLFWLEERTDGPAVIDRPDFVHSDGESSWIHTLFGAVWLGDAERITDLQKSLLPRYFRDPGTLLHGQPTRERWLEEMERDTVLYRLLHKGYERYFPIGSPYAGMTAIDGDSAFYDPRFRRIATELYLGRVFLPLMA